MGGGIIIRRADILLAAVSDASIYDSLTDEVKDEVEAVRAKGPGQRTAADVNTLSEAIASVCSD